MYIQQFFNNLTLFMYYFIFYVMVCGTGRLLSWAWWSAQIHHGAGNFIYSGASYIFTYGYDALGVTILSKGP